MCYCKNCERLCQGEASLENDSDSFLLFDSPSFFKHMFLAKKIPNAQCTCFKKKKKPRGKILEKPQNHLETHQKTTQTTQAKNIETQKPKHFIKPRSTGGLPQLGPVCGILKSEEYFKILGHIGTCFSRNELR